MSRGRTARKPILGEMIAMARARFTGVPARKARYVADLLRGLSVAQATHQLMSLHRPSSVPIMDRLLKSAVANAKEKSDLDPNELVIGEIFVDAGAMLKRLRPRAMGRGARVRKRTSHMTIKLFTEV
jgi:large subunit ribosomal protein L22